MLYTVATRRRASSLFAIASVTALGLGVVTGTDVAVAATPSVTIQDPGAVTAGPVTLRGAAAAGTLTTTVLFVVDSSLSTAHPSERDCDGNGNFGPKDNLNGDATTGDVLDCEISAVRSLTASLAASAGSSMVSLEHFAGTAVTDDLDPGPATVVFDSPATLTPGTDEPRVVTAARKFARATDSGTTFDAATNLALQTLAQAPAGPKWIMFLSDGQVKTVVPATVTKLASSGVHLRSFAINATPEQGCADGLGDLAHATGDACFEVSDPANLASTVSTTQPDGVAAVRVTIGGKTFATTLDLAGGWSANLTLGAGTYAAHVTATLSSGKTVSADRSFTVAAGPAGSPPPNSVAGTAIGGAGIRAAQPRPLLAALPAVVRGRVGRGGSTGTLTADATLDGATVLLQGRGKPGSAWVNVGKGKVQQGGYAVSWKPRSTIRALRVMLLPYRTFTGASAPVRRAGISDCHRSGSAASWTLTCRTTAANGKPARLLKAGKVVDRATVRRHHVSVSGSGRMSSYVLVVKAASTSRFRLHL